MGAFPVQVIGAGLAEKSRHHTWDSPLLQEIPDRKFECTAEGGGPSVSLLGIQYSTARGPFAAHRGALSD